MRSDEDAQNKLLGVTRKATAMVEAPSETIWRLLFIPIASASIRTAIEMGLFEALDKSDRPQTAADLAKVTGGDKLLIVRFLRP